MAVVVENRKRKASAIENSGPDDDDAEIRARLRKAFEAKFKPLSKSEPTITLNQDFETNEENPEDDVPDDVDDSNWDGFSEDENVIEVVEHGNEIQLNSDELKREAKAFMSSKPPTIQTSQAPRPPKPTAQQDATDDATNLKNDLALQRLLKESHLLDPSAFATQSPSSSSSTLTTTPRGKSRLKALDMRLASVGSQGSDARMPMSHRKGIVAKAVRQEATRRKEAAENGIILERAGPKGNKASADGTRGRGGVRGGGRGGKERGLGAPAIGRLKGGTLMLSSKDVRAIEGPKERGGRGGGRGRGGRGSGRR